MSCRRIVSYGVLLIGLIGFSLPAVAQETGSEANAAKVKEKKAVDKLEEKLKDKGLSKNQVDAVLEMANQENSGLNEKKLRQMIDKLNKKQLLDKIN
jgi:SOS response regulatory protein OraA/RecX